MGDSQLMEFKNSYISIIPARGGSKGIKKKNLYPVLGKPLLYWTIKSSIESKKIISTWVTSDDDDILSFAKNLGAKTIKRPKYLSKDFSSSESAWLHAINQISKKISFNYIVGLQATSPIRKKNELDNAIDYFENQNSDSMFSGCLVTDHLLWLKNKNNFMQSINYKGGGRQPRQKLMDKYLENGSIYIFNREKFLKFKKRMFGNISVYEMPNFRSLQIDEYSDIKFCEAVMKYFKYK